MQFLGRTLRQKYVSIILGFVIVLVLLRPIHDIIPPIATMTDLGRTTSKAMSAVAAARNRTIGFEQLIYISMDG
jgi:hypothetical protein